MRAEYLPAAMAFCAEFVAVDNPHANKLTIHILAVVAQHEREIISARTSAALVALSDSGDDLVLKCLILCAAVFTIVIASSPFLATGCTDVYGRGGLEFALAVSALGSLPDEKFSEGYARSRLTHRENQSGTL
jgi:hypothetical protein